MKNILFIPLDERPCNYSNIVKLIKENININFIYPPKEIFHNVAKHPVDTNILWNFIEENISSCDYMILSIDMLFYGGLIPSRIHNKKDIKVISDFVDRIKKLKLKYPSCKIFASTMIMRTPRYNSDRQEPDYYGTYGFRIFRYGVLKDKTNRKIITIDEENEFKKLKSEIPEEYILDFERRRIFNTNLVSSVISLVNQHIIELLIIPQDDSYPFGYTALDQQTIYKKIKDNNLNSRILTYNGADESGYTLTARVLNEVNQTKPQIYVFYSSINGEFVTPKYEDRPIGESLKSHLLAAGFRLTSNPESADIILAYNTPAREMIEASEQLNFSQETIIYERERNLPYFVDEVKYYLEKGKRVAICDSAYANGGDIQLLKMLNDKTNLLSKLLSYRAWNTNCNSLGSVLGEIALLVNAPLEEVKKNLLCNIFEDILYEGIVRQELIVNYLPLHPEISYDEIEKRVSDILPIIHHRITTLYDQLLNKDNFNLDTFTVSLPWNRLFNATFSVELENEKA